MHHVSTKRCTAAFLFNPHCSSRCSSALSQPGDIPAKTPTDPDSPSSDHAGSASAEPELDEAGGAAAALGTELLGTSSANDMLCTSQTLDDEPLTPEVVAPPKAIITPRSVNGNCITGQKIAKYIMFGTILRFLLVVALVK